MSNDNDAGGLSGFLSYTDIGNEIKKGAQSQIKIRINDVLIDESNPYITPVGYDVTLGDRKPFDLTSHKFLKIKVLSNSRSIEIKPGHTVSVETEESIELGQGIGALVNSKVRMVSRGFSHISTTIDPMWHGKLLLTFTNNSCKSLRIQLGMPIATLVFFRFLSPVVGRSDVYMHHNEKIWADYGETENGRNRRLAFSILAICIILIPLVWYLLSLVWIDVVKIYNGLDKYQKGAVWGVIVVLVPQVLSWLWKAASKYILRTTETIRK